MWFSAALAVHAQEMQTVRANPDAEAVTGVSYADLVAMALPGAHQIGDVMVIDRDVALPHIEGEDFTIALRAPVEVNSIEALETSVEGRPHLALLIDLAEDDNSAGTVAGLALFDVAGAPKLIDVADVGFDRMVSFAEPAGLSVGGGQDLLLISNRHGNAGQFYDATSIVEVVEGKLLLVDMVMMLSDQGCAGSRTQSAVYETDGAAAAPASFAITVTDRIEGPTDQCEGVEAYAPGTTDYSVTYAWDEAASRYVAEGDGWAALDEVNGERY